MLSSSVAGFVSSYRRLMITVLQVLGLRRSRLMAAPSLTTFWQMSMHFATVPAGVPIRPFFSMVWSALSMNAAAASPIFAGRRVEAREVGAHVLVVDEGLHNVFTGVFHGVFSYLGMYSCLK
jgi:hypothetical protein